MLQQLLNAELSEGTLLWIIIGAVLLIIILLGVIFAITKKKKDPRKNLDVVVPELQDAQLSKNNEMYVVLSRNVTFDVGPDKKIGIGSYILRNAADNNAAFNIRLNGLVKEYHNNDKIVLGEGDTICCTSDSITLIADLPDKF